MTAAAQVVKKHGFDTDPGRLNETMKDTPGGFKGKDLMPTVMVDAITTQGMVLTYSEIRGTNSQKQAILQENLNSGNPVILELYSACVVKGSHFVVATKKCGDTIYINDPGHNNSVTTLEQYFNLVTNGNPKVIRSIRKITRG